jgi:hypothetical protein
MFNLLGGLANETVSLSHVDFVVLVVIAAIFISDQRRQHVFDFNPVTLSFDV